MANAEPTVGDWVVIAVGFVVLVTAIVVSVGLYRFRQWAKRLLLPIHLMALILMPFYGPSVMTGWPYALCYLYAVLTGGLLFLVYLSPVGDAERSVLRAEARPEGGIEGEPLLLRGLLLGLSISITH